ncbi:MFS transporter [Streptomyces sp. SID14515]|uniref:MFS transporter n=1 Tax=Streptomyces sp. SID14515 TaxID=2706074 RepID=UPI0013CB5A3A|nr:MFS transporter [Streptomyces sp. SID14515]NEB41538.1 MFS transporter [Streptomyces sp. SID14515]
MLKRSTESTPAHLRRPDRRAWLVTAMIVMFMVINFADKAVLGLAAHPIMEELDISKSTYGAISSSFYVLFSLSGLVVGFFSTRISSHVLLCVMTALWAVVQLPVLVVAAVPTLIAGRVLLGAAEGPAASMSMHALYKWFPAERRAFPSALQISGAALGTLISAPLLTWVITAHGWRAAFASLAVVSAGWSLVWFLMGQDGPYGEEHPARHGTGPADRPGVTATTPVPYRRLLLNGTVIGSIASAFGASWALSLSSAWLPVYLSSQLDMTPARAATTISIISGLSLVLLLAVSPVVDALKSRGVSSRWSSGALQGGAVVVAGCAMASFPLVDATGPRLILIAVAFGGHAIAIPLHYVTTAEVVPTGRRGAVFGIVAATGTLPGLVAPFLSGRVIDGAASEQAGYATVFLIAAAVMVVSGAAAMSAIHPERDAPRIRAAGKHP